MEANSRVIVSNQVGIHDNLAKEVNKHLKSTFSKPIAAHTQTVFDRICEQLNSIERPLILDACCGVGDSSRYLAKQHPNHWVIGIDKSANRINRERDESAPSNLILERADLNDFYRLAVQANWIVDKHYILYPNPWPKSAHLKRRWHGSPAFPYIVKLGGQFEMRSNWSIYLEEFKAALALVKHDADIRIFEPETPITPFERKYQASGQKLYRLTASL